MASLNPVSAPLVSILRKFKFNPRADNSNVSSSCNVGFVSANCRIRANLLRQCSGVDMSFVVDSQSEAPISGERDEEWKKVWIWTENKEVMTAAVERGWNTFLFISQNQELAKDWSSIAFIDALFIEDGRVIDSKGKQVASFFEVSCSEDLNRLQPDNYQNNIVIDLLDWQAIPAENIVAGFHGSPRMVFAVSKTPSEAQMFLEALEHGLGGVVLKVENVKYVLDLKAYFDRRNEVRNRLSLCKGSITRVHAIGMGDRVCVDICSLMKPGEGLLVGSFARGLFLVHSECLESNYIASRPFRVNAGPVHAYVAIPGGKTSYLSELRAGKEVIVVDQEGKLRTAIVGRVKIESRPLIVIEAKLDSDDENLYSIFLQNAETVSLVCPHQGKQERKTAIPVTALKAGDEVLLKLQGCARHTGIEIQEFIIEK